MRKLIMFALLPVVCAFGQAGDSALATALQASYAAEAKGDYPAAIKPLADLGPADSAHYIAQLRLGWLHYCTKNWNESIPHYFKAVQQAPNAIEPLLGLMLPQQAAGKNDEALRTAQMVLRLDPNNYTALSRTAWLLYLAKDYRGAAATYRKLVAWYPADSEMLLGLGYSLKLAGQTQEAAQHFRTVLLLSPNNTRALEGLNK